MPERFQRAPSPSGGITHRKPIRDSGTSSARGMFAVCPRLFCARPIVKIDDTLECPKHGAVMCRSLQDRRKHDGTRCPAGGYHPFPWEVQLTHWKPPRRGGGR